MRLWPGLRLGPRWKILQRPARPLAEISGNENLWGRKGEEKEGGRGGKREGLGNLGPEEGCFLALSIEMDDLLGSTAPP